MNFNGKRSYIILLVILLIISVSSIFAQSPNDSVDATFFYKPDGNPSNVYLPGEFNGWVINNPQTRMTLNPSTGVWSKTVRLRVGGPDPLPAPTSIPGAYQYKFHADGTWLSDPLNPRQNPDDFNNSYLFINDPTIHYLLPNSTQAVGILRTRFPQISAYIFPAIGSQVDTSSIMLQIDSLQFTNIGDRYDTTTHKLSFTPPVPLGDGRHDLLLSVASDTGQPTIDTTSFTVQADVVQILSLPADTWKDQWRIRGAFFRNDGGFDSTVTTAQILRPDSVWTISVTSGRVDTSISLLEGDNIFRLRGVVGGQLQTSDSLVITRMVNHSPRAEIDITPTGTNIELSAANSTDPDSQSLSFLWREDAENPELLGIAGQTTTDLTVAKPGTEGEYFIELFAEDPDGNLDSTRAYFTVQTDSPEVDVAEYADNPQWVKNGRIYLLFFKAFTPTGTIRAAIPNLQYIKDMGFNIIWVLPVMEIAGDVDNQVDIGYNIIDFLSVETSYGTAQDFNDFVSEAHNLGLKVILDVTPNHTGRLHPFAQEALVFGNFSPFWNYYQTEFISHNTNGLGQCVTPEGIYYYCGFSDALLNYDWRDLDARNYMIEVYEHWVNKFGIDGYRLDAYWGPHRKYGEQNMGIPVRESLKDIKPDILLLGEDDGTGVGTEVIYADRGAGLDAAYDSKLYFQAIRDFSFSTAGVNNLHSKLHNNGFYPGENSYFLRFMENQDEDRLTYIYDSFVKTMPIATTIFTAPGLPQMHNGQEVGFGRGMGAPGEPDLNDRRRGIIDWNFGGRDLLRPHYQRLAHIRAQFPAFSQHKRDTNGDGQVNAQDSSDFVRVSSSNGIVYSFTRPYKDENGVTAVNFSGSSRTATLDIAGSGLKFTGGFDPTATYWINNLYSDTSFQVQGSELQNFNVNLSAYGSAIYTVSVDQEQVVLPPLPTIVGTEEPSVNLPDGFQLKQNYPNPFNPETTIAFEVAQSVRIKLTVYNILGQQVKTLVNRFYQPGQYTLHWDGRNDNGQRVASGIYIIRMQAGDFVQHKRMVLLR